MTAPLREHIARARASLVGAGLAPDDAALDAEVLARHVLGWDRAQLLTRSHLPPDDQFSPAFDAAIARRAAREPVALITGHREFWGLDIEVTRDVLIPRPETELIVEQAIRRFARRSGPRIIDVGTGSGCIAIALTHELPAARVLAIDRSAAALAVAARNVRRHGWRRGARARQPARCGGGPCGSDRVEPTCRGTTRPYLQPEVVRFENRARPC